jgi:hypothetical protein
MHSPNGFVTRAVHDDAPLHSLELKRRSHGQRSLGVATTHAALRWMKVPVLARKPSIECGGNLELGTWNRTTLQLCSVVACKNLQTFF